MLPELVVAVSQLEAMLNYVSEQINEAELTDDDELKKAPKAIAATQTMIEDMKVRFYSERANIRQLIEASGLAAMPHFKHDQ